MSNFYSRNYSSYVRNDVFFLVRVLVKAKFPEVGQWSTKGEPVWYTVNVIPGPWSWSGPRPERIMSPDGPGPCFCHMVMFKTTSKKESKMTAQINSTILVLKN
jgi:hypothetical protein